MFATIIGGGIVMRATSLSGLIPPAASQYRNHMAWVPGWSVMAKTIGRPLSRRSCARARRSRALEPRISRCLIETVIAWPLRLRIQGITSGLCSVPSFPTAAATGMPKSMCAACALPLIRLSRLAVQFPNFITLDSIPCLKKNPFAWATTIGAQSVKGRIPNVSCLTSGSPASATSSARPRSSNSDRSKPPPLEEETPVDRLAACISAFFPFALWRVVSIPFSLSCC